jgi:hypothetical protein
MISSPKDRAAAGASSAATSAPWAETAANAIAEAHSENPRRTVKIDMSTHPELPAPARGRLLPRYRKLS